MQESTTREKVLKRIRKSLINRTPNPYPAVDMESNVFVRSEQEREIEFAENFTAAGGQFVFCESEIDFLEGLVNLAGSNSWKIFYCEDAAIQELLKSCDFPYVSEFPDINQQIVSITSCESLIARSGSVLVSAGHKNPGRPYALAEVHIVLARTSQITGTIKTALSAIKNASEGLPHLLTIITGPSLSSDIERTLVYGVHGPKELYLFLVDDTE